MANIEPLYSLSERQICARLQRFYDLMWEHRHKSLDISSEQVKVEDELDILMNEYAKLFPDIVYIDER